MSYTDEELDQLEQEEHNEMEEALAAMLVLLYLLRDRTHELLYDFYGRYGRNGVVTYVDVRKWVSPTNRTRRLNVLFSELADEFSGLFDDLDPEFEDALRKIITAEMEFFDSKVDLEKLLAMKWGSDDANWKDRLLADVELWLHTIGADLKRSFLQRKTITEVLKQIDKRFDSIEYTLEKLAYTESTALGSLARRAIFKELGIGKYRFYSRPDERRCEVCGSLHGLVFPITAYEVGVTASPIHPRCRCWEVPIID